MWSAREAGVGTRATRAVGARHTGVGMHHTGVDMRVTRAMGVRHTGVVALCGYLQCAMGCGAMGIRPSRHHHP